MTVKLNITWKDSDDIALALSGGVDSMVLYHLLSTTYKNTYRSLTIFHINHGQRRESDDELKVLKELAHFHGHLFLSKKLDLSAFSQQTGRIERYRFFNEMMEKHKISYCLTAHHLDDDVETVLHELLSNRYLYGVGIPEQNEKFVRPLMCVKKTDIYDYQKAHDVYYMHDFSNDSTDYTRNYIRHHVVPSIDHHESLDTSSLIDFKNDYNEMVVVVEEAARKYIDSYEYTYSRDTFNNLSSIVKVFVIAGLFNGYVERTFIDECMRMLESDVAQTKVRAKNRVLTISYDTFFIGEKVVDDTLNSLEITSPGKYLFNGYEIDVREIDEPVQVRLKEPGDRVYIPNVGTKKLSRIFIDKKIPSWKREIMPVVVDSNAEIIAVGSVYNIIKSLNQKINLEIKECLDDTEK